MKNDISIRQGPEFNFIIPEHQVAFEWKVIDCYEKSLKEKNLWEYKLPHIEKDLFDYVQLADPIHFVAARLSRDEDDDQFYERHLKQLSYEAEFKFAVDYFKAFDELPRDKDSDELFYYDIVAVLNFHHMSFVDLGHVNEWGFWKNGNFYKNLPMRQVW